MPSLDIIAPPTPSVPRVELRPDRQTRDERVEFRPVAPRSEEPPSRRHDEKPTNTEAATADAPSDDVSVDSQRKADESGAEESQVGFAIAAVAIQPVIAAQEVTVATDVAGPAPVATCGPAGAPHGLGTANQSAPVDPGAALDGATSPIPPALAGSYDAVGETTHESALEPTFFPGPTDPEEIAADTSKEVLVGSAASPNGPESSELKALPAQADRSGADRQAVTVTAQPVTEKLPPATAAPNAALMPEVAAHPVQTTPAANEPTGSNAELLTAAEPPSPEAFVPVSGPQPVRTTKITPTATASEPSAAEPSAATVATTDEASAADTSDGSSIQALRTTGAREQSVGAEMPRPNAVLATAEPKSAATAAKLPADAAGDAADPRLPANGSAPTHGLLATPVQAERFAISNQTSFVVANPTGATAVMHEQIAVQVAHAVHEGTDRLIVQLRPQSLGRIRIELEVGPDNRVQAVIGVERQETLDLLQRDARGLERALNDAGLKADAGSLSFNLRGEGNHDGRGLADNRFESLDLAEPTETPAPAPQIYRAYTRSTADGIDIRV